MPDINCPISAAVVEAERLIFEQTGVRPNCIRIPFNLYADWVIEMRVTGIQRFGNLDVEIFYKNGDTFTILNTANEFKNIKHARH